MLSLDSIDSERILSRVNE